ncbi:Dit2 protein [Scheffersomyces coipomensis]|uniref:Dit2 protein n=1 Tax=Scheffersomyces coipomensis TaxID=1788519 RepID=UPI00315CDF2E
MSEMVDYMFYLRTISSVVIGVFVYVISTIIIPPFEFPTNIPTIPFYVSFLGTYTNMDQEEIYNKYLRAKLEKYGAVKIYFASRWNILVTKPEYLQEVFKYEDIYAKSGNQEKIPYSVLANYTGNNIISAHGKQWKLYRNVVQQSIQFPNIEPVHKNSQLLVKLIQDQITNKGDTFSVMDILQKYALANVGESVIGMNFKSLEEDDNELHNKIKYVKSQIFKPLYLNFPFLDMLPIPSRQKAMEEVRKFRDYFAQLVLGSRQSGETSNLAGNKLIEAYQNNSINFKSFTDNIIILMVAGHENPLLLMLSLLYVIAKNRHVQDQIRKEILEGVDNLPYTQSVIYETLRMYPPLGQIINRRTTRPVMLGNKIKIPQNVYVGYNNFGTGRDANIWNNADQFQPERWGHTLEEINSNYSIAKRNAQLPAFHGGKRACLGEKFALLETRAVVVEILTNYDISLAENWKDKLTPAGPVCPLMLKIKFETHDKKSIH